MGRGKGTAAGAAIAAAQPAAAPTKGERTSARILDAAETVFAERGFESASLRAIAQRAGLQQPGLYNHFSSKRDLYAAVLERALGPMAEAMTAVAAGGVGADVRRPRIEDLPAIMTEILLDHPQMAALFQQALQGQDSPGQELIRDWLDRLLAQGIETARRSAARPIERSALAIEILAMFHVTTGYFLSQHVFDSLGLGDLKDPANIARQKSVLSRMSQALDGRHRNATMKGRDDAREEDSV